MSRPNVNLAVCSFTSTPSVWEVRWSAADNTLESIPTSLQVDRAFSLAAHPRGELLALGMLKEKGEVLFLRRSGTAEHPDLMVDARLELPGVDLVCRVRFDPQARMLAVAGYSSGTVSTVHLDTEGLPSGEAMTIAFEGSGPDPSRQDRPYIHDVTFTRDLLLAADLGSDVVRTISVASGEEGDPIVCPTGSGPRHVADAGNGRIVISGELDSTLMLFRPDGDGFVLADTVSATSVSTSARNYPSTVVADPASGFVHIANRGADTILTASIEGDRLSVVGEIPSGGERPEHMVISGDHLLVAHSTDGAVTALQLVGGRPSGEASARTIIPGAIWIEALAPRSQ